LEHKKRRELKKMTPMRMATYPKQATDDGLANLTILNKEIGIGKFGKWGNSSAVRIPAEVMKLAQVTDASEIRYFVSTEGDIVLRPKKEEEAAIVAGKPRSYYTKRMDHMKEQIEAHAVDGAGPHTEAKVWGLSSAGVERFWKREGDSVEGEK
jgi:antitoxin component of MazEF toxin-antitoxin module